MVRDTDSLKRPLINIGIGAVAVIIVGMITLMGIIFVDAVGKGLRSSTTDNRSSSTDVTALLVNQSVDVGTSGQFPFLQSLTGCVNATGDEALLTTYYTISEGPVTGTGGSIRLNDLGFTNGWNGTGVNCSSIGYLAATSSSNAANLFVVGLGFFGIFISLIVIGIIGKELIGMFRFQKGN